jgi:Protein of unknown function (DUF2892)
MIYRKNLYSWEAMLRILVGPGLAAYAFFAMAPGWLAYVLVASGIGFAITGLVGWCPMCAMIGRKIADKS